MDRDTRWDRVQKAYNLYTQGVAEDNSSHNNNKTELLSKSLEAIKDCYASGQTDEFVKPLLLTGEIENIKSGTIKDGDGVIFFNFRSDRAREITRALTDDKFTGFERETVPKLSGFICMTQYDESFSLPVIFKPQHLYNILGEVVSRQGLAQLRIAETE